MSRSKAALSSREEIVQGLVDRPLDYALQPIRRFHRGNWTPQRLEWLVRPEKYWHLSTLDFIYTLSSVDLQTHLDIRVVGDAVGHLARNPRHVLGVNVSADSLADRDFVSGTIHRLQEAGVAGSRLYLEITEHRPLAGYTTTALECRRLREIGVRVGLDDVGSGHHATTTALEMSFIDYIKIDRGLISRSPRDSLRYQRLYQMLRSAHGLGLEIVVEGIETRAQLKMAFDMNVRMAQGYLWEAPVNLRHAGTVEVPAVAAG